MTPATTPALTHAPSIPRLYFDHAATSFPKPPEVLAAMTRYATEIGASPGRGAYAEAIAAGDVVSRCRASINRLIGGSSPDHLIFTLNASDALNLAIKGITAHHLRREEPAHLITTWMDHNSVLRPCHALTTLGIERTDVPCDPETGRVDPRAIAAAIRPETRLVATLYGSNVSGTIQPIAEIGAVCRDRGVPFLVDAAQTLGHVPVDMDAMGIDLLAFPGHKGLLGPLGTGGLYIRPGLEERIEPLREGGTGSQSEKDVQPEFMPDKYEPGSPNAIGIAGLGAAVEWILERTVDALWTHERALMAVMLDGLRDAPGVRLLGPQTLEDRCGVFSIVVDGLAPEDVSDRLERDHGILTRSGLHCAPRAHATFGTHDRGGATRLSLGAFHTEDDVRRAADAVRAVAEARVAVTT